MTDPDSKCCPENDPCLWRHTIMPEVIVWGVHVQCLQLYVYVLLTDTHDQLNGWSIHGYCYV